MTLVRLLDRFAVGHRWTFLTVLAVSLVATVAVVLSLRDRDR